MDQSLAVMDENKMHWDRVAVILEVLASVTVPLVLKRMGFDPVLCLGAFVITLTDLIGFFAFLGLATVILL